MTVTESAYPPKWSLRPNRSYNAGDVRSGREFWARNTRGRAAWRRVAPTLRPSPRDALHRRLRWQCDVRDAGEEGLVQPQQRRARRRARVTRRQRDGLRGLQYAAGGGPPAPRAIFPQFPPRASALGPPASMRA